MERDQIIALASHIMQEIEQRLNAVWYQELGGKISIEWTTQPVFNAWALSGAGVNEPPLHRILLSQHLALNIFEDAVNYCQVAETEFLKPLYEPLFGEQDADVSTTLPTEFQLEDCQHIMFVAAFTWVVFHELGHLTQEHGYIRRHFSKWKPSNLFMGECEIFGQHELNEQDVGFFQVTELAADFEAVDWCILDLMTTFSGADYIASSYLLVCGISCVVQRFFDGQPLDKNGKIHGTHPNPILRMEFVVPHVIELLDSEIVREKTAHGFTRLELSDLLSKASYSSVLYWHHRFRADPLEARNLLLQGMVVRSEAQIHLRKMVEFWDLLASEVEKVRRFGSPLALMSFTDEIRERL